MNTIREKVGGVVRSLIAHATDTGTLAPDVREQLEYEQLKATSRLVPSLLLGNLFLASVTYVSTASFGFTSIKTSVYLMICFVCLFGYAVWRKKVSESKQSTAPRADELNAQQRFFLIISLTLGCLWATVPLLLGYLHNGNELILVTATLAAVFCVGGFVLAPMPVMALMFLAPITVSSFAALAFAGTSQALVNALALVIYVAFIFSSALSSTRTLVKVVVSGQEVAKQQRTISLLLKDFEKHASDWLWETDSEMRFVRPSVRFSEVSGVPAQTLASMKVGDFFNKADTAQAPALEIFLGSLNRRISINDLQVPVSVANETNWWSLTGTPTFDEAGMFSGYHGVGSDITMQKRSDERISFLAHNDALTGLFNRANFTEILNQNVSRLERYGAPFALMFMDLDHFKAINDTHGHPMGDRLLIEVANRLRSVTPASAFLARLGGDEFAILIPKSVSIEDIEALAKRLLKSITRTFEIDNQQMSVGISIGVAIAPRHGTRPDQILRNVDLALYRAKESGRAACKIFESGMDSQARERRALEFDMRSAVQNNELELFYQPLMGAESNKPVGFEALIRWNHPIRGRIFPAEFVPIAENNGLIKEIGDWVIREACREAATWPNDLSVAVNLSAPQFEKDRIVDVVIEALAESGLAPERLEVEITESLLIDRPDEVLATLVRLKDLGVSIAMDDFGTGYSSLAYLLKFPFDKIKIDKSFISAIDRDKAACDVLRTIGSLGKTLNIRITAEGVETEEQVKFLRAIACDQLQGYFFAKPLQSKDIAAFLLGNWANYVLDETLPSQPDRSIAA